MSERARYFDGNLELVFVGLNWTFSQKCHQLLLFLKAEAVDVFR
jgi:hypothetical protein